MRVLVATTAGAGHMGPLLPFAGVLRSAGHDVVMAAPECFAPAVARAGYEHRPFADGSRQAQAAVFATLGALSSDEANAVVVGEVFGRIDAGRPCPGCERWWRSGAPTSSSGRRPSTPRTWWPRTPGSPTSRSPSAWAFEELCLPVLEAPLAELGSVAGVAGLRAAPRLSLFPASFEGRPPPPPGASVTRPASTTATRCPTGGRVQPNPSCT